MRHKNEENDKDAQNKNITDTIQSVKHSISLSFQEDNDTYESNDEFERLQTTEDMKYQAKAIRCK